MRQRFADRRDWQRVIERSFRVLHLQEPGFRGYVTLFEIEKVREPLWVDSCGRRICSADDGYSWLQQLPAGQHYAVTTMFDWEYRVVHCYLDICRRHGVSADGVPWWDDLYLDIIVTPDGRACLYDEDEFEEALRLGAISRGDYDLAWRESR